MARPTAAKPAAPAPLRVEVAPDASEARLVLPVGYDPQQLTAERCRDLLRQAGVEWTDAVAEAVGHLVADPPSPNEPSSHVVARATLPMDGTDGRIEWTVQPDNPAAAPPATSTDDADTDADPPDSDAADDPDAPRIDHYSRSAFVMVEPGQSLGRVHRPTAGEPGRDVRGNVLAARSGREASLQLDESIIQRPSGELVANMQGVLVREGTRASIRKCLDVPESVDFSTGHIDFDGQVHVRGGVCDRFIVKATGDIVVHGLIEAATIETDADLHALGGFAGRERGSVRIAGSLHARYLDSVRGHVERDLVVEREVINCQLTVHGQTLAPQGAILGGQLAVVGAVRVGTLGARTATPTQLIVGRVPKLAKLAYELEHLLQQLTDRRDQLENRTLPNDPTRRKLEQQVAHAKRALDQLRTRIEKQRVIDVRVERRLHPGVILTAGSQHFRIHEEVRGPLHITRNLRGQITYQVGESEPRLLAHIADVQIRPT